MAIEDNKRVIVEFHDRVINGLDFAVVPRYMHEDVQHRRGAIGYTLSQMDPEGVARLRSLQGFERFIEATRLLRRQFPEWRSTIDEIVAEGDTVVTRCTVRGRCRDGRFLNRDGPGAAFELPQVVIQQVVDGRIKRIFAMSDELGFWRTLGVALPGSVDGFHGTVAPGGVQDGRRA